MADIFPTIVGFLVVMGVLAVWQVLLFDGRKSALRSERAVGLWEAASGGELAGVFDEFDPTGTPSFDFSGLMSLRFGRFRSLAGRMTRQIGDTQIAVAEFEFTLRNNHRFFTQTVLGMWVENLELPQFYARPRSLVYPWLTAFDPVAVPMVLDCEYAVESTIPGLARRFFDVVDDIEWIEYLRARQWIVEADRGRVVLYRLGEVVPPDKLPQFMAEGFEYLRLLRERKARIG